MPPTEPDNRTDIFSVSRLTTELRAVIDGSFPLLWVEGEISNLASPRSGHLYFSLKDAQAQIRCALFRARRSLLRMTPENGTQVLVRARMSVYEPRGDLQLIVEHMELAGEGALQRAYEELKRKLAAAGLFDAERKHPLPTWPHRVGVITSTSGAALHDILKVLATRFPPLAVRVFPAQVQGEAAPPSLRAALRTALTRGDCDLLLLARGGGSLEDLWAFNDEGLARDIAAAKIPIVSAVGHETDYTIADFVADRRAPTPSAAAELISPDARALLEGLDQYAQRVRRQLRHGLDLRIQRLDHALERLLARHPRQLLEQQHERLVALHRRIVQSLRLNIARNAHQLARLDHRLLAQSPQTRLRERRRLTGELTARLERALRVGTGARSQRLAALARQLDTVSPLRTLDRGYAIVRDAQTGAVLRRAATVPVGSDIEILLAQGTLIAKTKSYNK